MAIEVDFTYAIAVLEHSDDIIQRRFGDIALNEERQGGPNVQGHPCRYSGCTMKLQIQATL